MLMPCSVFSDSMLVIDRKVIVHVARACVVGVFVHACMCACLLVCMCVHAAGCADLMTLDTMTPQERKRQGYIHELIQTEETYVEDLDLVLEVRTNTDTNTSTERFRKHLYRL